MEAQEFCRFIWHIYLEKKDYQALENLLAPDLSVIGTGAHELCRNREQALRKLTEEEPLWDGHFSITSQWYQTTPLGEETFLVIGELTLRQISSQPLAYNAGFRFSMVVRRAPESWQLVHIHRSVPDPEQMTGEPYPRILIQQSNRKLEELLEIRRQELENANREALYYARYDYLTDLMNRPFLESEVQALMKKKPYGAMMMMDVDDFKQVNDRNGHPFGDQVLSLLAESLKASFTGCLSGRIGGDEFLVYTGGDEPEMEDFLEMARAFCRDWDCRQKRLGLSRRISICMGIALYPQHGDNYESLWQNADKALYISKRSGKSAIAVADGRSPQEDL